MFIGSIVGPTGVLLKSTDNQKYSMYNSIFTTGANVVINIMLIPMLGIIGAAYASIASSLIGNFASAIESYYEEGIHGFHKGLIPIFVASFSSLAITYTMINMIRPVTPLWILIPGAVMFGIIYVLILVGLGGLKEEDREIMEEFGKKLGMEKEADYIADIVIRD
jgi:O-antigen/teichoic acid export membrane protein